MTLSGGSAWNEASGEFSEERRRRPGRIHVSGADGTCVILYLVELLDPQPVLRSCFLPAPERPLLLHLLQLLVQSAENQPGGGGQSREIVERWKWIFASTFGFFHTSPASFVLLWKKEKKKAY